LGIYYNFIAARLVPPPIYVDFFLLSFSCPLLPSFSPCLAAVSRLLDSLPFADSSLQIKAVSGLEIVLFPPLPIGENFHPTRPTQFAKLMLHGHSPFSPPPLFWKVPSGSLLPFPQWRPYGLASPLDTPAVFVPQEILITMSSFFFFILFFFIGFFFHWTFLSSKDFFQFYFFLHMQLMPILSAFFSSQLGLVA